MAGMAWWARLRSQRLDTGHAVSMTEYEDVG